MLKSFDGRYQSSHESHCCAKTETSSIPDNDDASMDDDSCNYNHLSSLPSFSEQPNEELSPHQHSHGTIASNSQHHNHHHQSVDNSAWPSQEELSRCFSVWRMEGELNTTKT